MKPLFHPQLINGPFGDPGVFIDFLFAGRAVLFDLGDIAPLPPRKILRVSDVFVSHTHMDHFIGFDHLLRISLGRTKEVRLYGPAGFVDQVGHRLASYTWNLVENYTSRFTILASELHADGTVIAARFDCRRAFDREDLPAVAAPAGVLLDEETFRVRAVCLDHSIPCLAFCLEEKNHVNVMKNRLADLGLPVGPWLTALKLAVVREEPDASPIRIHWKDVTGTGAERVLPLEFLKREILRIVPGQKIAYVTDTACTAETAGRIVSLAAAADYLFIEAPFLAEDAERAAARYHLTTSQARSLAREAGAARVIPFHFSPRYLDREEQLRKEVRGCEADAEGKG